MTLAELGWNDRFEAEFAPYRERGWKPARLIRDHKINYAALLEDGDVVDAVLAGKILHEAKNDADLPAVGDWVALELGNEDVATVIHARLKRQTCLSRKTSGRGTEEQVIAANVDLVVVVTDAGPDFNLRRMERYFAIIGRSGAKPVVLVNKADLFSKAENEEAARAIRELNPEADVHITSAEKKRTLQVLNAYLKPGVSMALVGSSGVGKSSITNQLLGDDYQYTDEVNEVTGRGRHSTTARELIVLPRGGILIDNPGIREVHMWTDETSVRDRFADIEKLAAECKFDDCKHRSDAGCAIRAAIAAGTLSPARYESYLKLEGELAELHDRVKRRQITGTRRAKREQQREDRKFAARKFQDHDDEPPWKRG
jgi:ribosome biogenesis GTPase / thiamine phosphate phosphatase